MTHPDDIPVDSDEDEAGLDAARINPARAAEADEADLIEQATVVPLDDDRGFDR